MKKEEKLMHFNKLHLLSAYQSTKHINLKNQNLIL